MTFRAVVEEVLERLPDVLAETAENYHKRGLDPYEGSLGDAIDAVHDPTPVADRLESFLMSLRETDVRKLEVFMYYGRGDGDLGSLAASLPRDTKEVTVKHVILAKEPALEAYFGKALENADREGLDIETGF